MSNDDFRLRNAQDRLKTLGAARQRAIANLAEYEADGDNDSAQETIGQIALLDAESTSIVALAQRHIDAQNPQPIPQTAEEWRVKSAEKMTGDDGLAVVNYGKKPGDPTWVSGEEYNRQVAILRHKKSNGEYQG